MIYKGLPNGRNGILWVNLKYQQAGHTHGKPNAVWSIYTISFPRWGSCAKCAWKEFSRFAYYYLFLSWPSRVLPINIVYLSLPATDVGQDRTTVTWPQAILPVGNDSVLETGTTGLIMCWTWYFSCRVIVTVLLVLLLKRAFFTSSSPLSQFWEYANNKNCNRFQNLFCFVNG